MAKPRLLFYLKPDLLEVYSDQVEGPARLDFPPEIVNYQEVFDPEKFAKSLEDFLGQIAVAQLEVVVLISQPLIFSKEFLYQESISNVDPNKPLLDYNALNTKIQAYIEATPFDNNHISKLELKGENSSLILVTNKSLYLPIVDLVTKLGGRVISVVPVTVFGDLGQKTILDGGDVDLVFDDKKTLQINNFLLSQNIAAVDAGKTVSPIVTGDEDDEEEEGNGKKSKILLILGALFIIGGLLVLGMMLGFVKNPLPKSAGTAPETSKSLPQPSAVVSVATESAILVGSPSAALQDIKKDQLKVNIINGSGVSGQGSKVKSILTPLGYKDITIGLTVLSGTTDTSISYSKKVTTVNKDELVQELGKTFLAVKTTEASSAARFDIEITTGIYK